MSRNRLSYPIISFLLAIQLLLVVSCSKREEYIPYRYVNFTVDLNINNNLATPGYSEIFPNEGYGGVIVFCENYDYSTPDNSIYHAYDAACTYDVADTCSLTIEGNSFYGTCPCCNSKYELINGNPVDGVALYTLKAYNVSVVNNILHVYN